MNVSPETLYLTKRHVELMILESAQEHSIQLLRSFIREQMQLDSKIITQRKTIEKQSEMIIDLKRALGISI
jgi:hypothetical protein